LKKTGKIISIINIILASVSLIVLLPLLEGFFDLFPAMKAIQKTPIEALRS